MKRLIAYVSGDVQRIGYRGRMMDIANAFGLKGMVENLKDGRVLIIAEGEDKKLEWFEDAIDIKNTLIKVSSIEKSYSSVSGVFDGFGKLVFKGETDTRLDKGVEVMGKMLVAINDVNAAVKEVNRTLVEMNSNLGSKIDHLSGKMDESLAKQDLTLEKQDLMLEKQDELLIEVKDLNKGLNDKIDKDIVELKADVSEIKSALRAKGII